MRYLLAITSLVLCSHVHADPLGHATQRKAIDYSKNHALSANPAPTSTARSALDDLLSNRGLGADDESLDSDMAISAQEADEQMTSWIAEHQKPESAAQDGTASAPRSKAASLLADRFANLVVDAISHIGVPYKYGGNSVESGGFDCSGFVRAVYHEALGTLLPRRAEEQAAATQRIDRAQLKPGDLVFFKTTRRAFSHVGIYVGEDKFVHAPRTGARIRIEALTSSYWNQRFNGARRVEVADNSADRTASITAATHLQNGPY